jgi:hypothetical protein
LKGLSDEAMAKTPFVLAAADKRGDSGKWAKCGENIHIAESAEKVNGATAAWLAGSKYYAVDTGKATPTTAADSPPTDA